MCVHACMREIECVRVREREKQRYITLVLTVDCRSRSLIRLHHHKEHIILDPIDQAKVMATTSF